MQSRFPVILLFFCAITAIASVKAQQVNSINAKTLTWTPQGIVIKLKDDLNHPVFSWPVSFLKYQLDFGPGGVTENELNLIDETTGKSILFQLDEVEIKNGRIQKARLGFLSNLPSGADKSFRLARGKKKPGQEAADGIASVTVDKTAGSYLISNGKIRIEIPSSQNRSITAPIKRFGNANKWLGYGQLASSFALTNFTVTELSLGPVQAAFQLSYKFGGNKHYTVKVKLTAAMEFAELDEEMSGFDIKDSAVWRMTWNGLQPDHRYASTRAKQIDNKQKGYRNVSWEPMEGLIPDPGYDKHPELLFDQENGKDGKLPFRIAPYDNWVTWWRLPCAAFWSEKENLSVGLFIMDMERWNDGLYSLWGSKENLNIYFHWKNKILDYTFPLVTGTRSTAITTYQHQKDIDLVNKNNSTLVYIDDLRRWYGWIPLDKIKKWILNYDTPETGYPKYFRPENAGAAFSLASLESQLSNDLKAIGTGTERIYGPSPVASRVYHDFLTPAFDLNAAQMNAGEYKKLRSWFLFISYLYMDEALMPMRNMFSGHPNFMADIKAVPGLAAFLFPRHPEASKMADHYEKFIHLNFNYHIRPEVPSWESLGGRWTENLATYTWAALKPELRTNYLLHHYYDGKNRLLQPGVSMLGNWLLNSISSPLIARSNRRVYPPQGAHSHSYGEGPPNALRLLGQELTYYDPLLSEKLFWLTTAEDNPFESNKERDKAWGEMLKGEWETNRGTNPHLKSAKYTGYGAVLRSGFGTKDEMYINLQQVDEGPNYRWGRAAMGGNGVIYYYAQGKRYSHNGAEDVGDGPFGDVERISNFGVKKPGGYRSIGPYRSVGRNDLTEPLYNFDFAQFATVKGNKDIAGLYHSRSVLQSNADYIAVFDEVASNTIEGRFSWFVGTDDDFPSIHQVLPGAVAINADIKPSRSNYHKDPDILPTKGRYYDGKGSFLTIVTHKPEIKVTKASFGCIVEKSSTDIDLIFRDSKNIHYQKEGVCFTGTAGIVQKTSLAEYAAALFTGTGIEVPGLQISLAPGNNAGISLQTSASGFSGKFQGRRAEQVSFTIKKPGLIFYLDGIVYPVKSVSPNTIQLIIPEGKHSWQLTDKGVRPGATEVISTIVQSHSVRLSWKAVPGAEAYLLQISKDGGSTWETAKDQVTEPSATITDLSDGVKVHFRVIGKGQGGNGEPSDEYPVYVTEKVSHAPEGLLLDLNGAQVKISWGSIFGAGSYQLYRRRKDPPAKTAFELVYTGSITSFQDKKPAPGIIYEYAVTAANGNGESIFSSLAGTDPGSFLNWEPRAGEGFRRDTEDHENGFVEFNHLEEVKKPVLSYPLKKQ